MEEFWKDVIGYEGWYQVSNYGKLKSIDRLIDYPNGNKRLFKGKTQKCSVLKGGYIYYDLYKNSKRKRFLAHILVYNSFKNDYNPNLDINHIDCNKQNNFIENLEQVTRSQNMKHALKNGLLDKTINSATKNYVLDNDGNEIDLKTLARKYGLSYSKVLSRFLKGYSFDEIIIKRKYNIHKYRREKQK